MLPKPEKLLETASSIALYYVPGKQDPTVDYYLDEAQGEPPGVWRGSALDEIDMRHGDVVSYDDLVSLLERKHPGNGTELQPGRPTPGVVSVGKRNSETGVWGKQKKASKGGIKGYDLQFTVPKSASLLAMLGGADVQREIETAFIESVEEGISYLEREAVRVHRGAQGKRQKRGQGFIAASFLQHSSRPAGNDPSLIGDPQLHMHVVVANLTRGVDDKMTSLVSPELFAHYMAAGAIQEAAFRVAVTRRLGYEWGPLENGLSDILGIPEAAIDLFSKRRKQILAAAGARADARSRGQAALYTRGKKIDELSLDDRKNVWEFELEEFGISSFEFADRARLAGQQARTERDLETVLNVGKVAKGLVKGELSESLKKKVVRVLTEFDNVFVRQDMIMALARMDVPVNELDEVADMILADAGVMLVGSDALTTIDEGFLVPSKFANRFTSQEVLQAERDVLLRVNDGKLKLYAGAHEDTLQTVLDQYVVEGKALGEDQEDMVRGLTLGNGAVRLVQARAGTGKTFALGAAGKVWAKEGVPAFGVAVSGKAAMGLEDGSGIPSCSIAKLFYDLDIGSLEIPEGAVIVVDEAGMAGTRQLDRLSKLLEKKNGKLILVGDSQQLSSVEAGGLFKDILVQHPDMVGGLSDNRRQRIDWERKAVERLHSQQNVAGIIKQYDTHDRIRVQESREDTFAAMVADYFAVLSQDKSSLMLAFRRKDVAELNDAAEKVAAELGMLGEERTQWAGREWRSGQRVLVTANSKPWGVSNGTTGVVVGLEVRPVKWKVEIEVLGETVLDANGMYQKKIIKMNRAGMIAVGDEIQLGDAAGKIVKANSILSEVCAVIKTDDGSTVTLPIDVAESVHSGWATTIHKSQGATVEATQLFASGLNANLTYVALTRGKGDLDEQSVVQNRMYVSSLVEISGEEGPWEGGASTTRIKDHEEILKELTAMAKRDGTEMSALTFADDLLKEQADLLEMQQRRSELAGLVMLAPPSSSHLRRKVEKELERTKDPAHRIQLQSRLEQLEPADGVILFEDAKRKEWLVAHADDIARLDALTGALDAEADVLVTLANTIRPEYLPERPEGVLGRSVWKSQVVAIETFRMRWGVDDAEAALGRRPQSGPQQREWDFANRVLNPSEKISQGHAIQIPIDGPSSALNGS